MWKKFLYLVGLSCLAAPLAQAQLGISPSQSARMLRELHARDGTIGNADLLGDERALLDQSRSLTDPQFLSSSLAFATRLQSDLTTYSSQYQEGRTFLSPWSGALAAPGVSNGDGKLSLSMAVDQTFERNEMRSPAGDRSAWLSTTAISVSAHHGTLDTGRLSLDFAGGVTLAGDDDLLLQHGDGRRAWFIQPGSSISYDVQFGPVTVTLYDRVSVRPDPLISTPGLFVISPFFGATQNDLGTAVTWQIRPDLAALVNCSWASSQATSGGSRDDLDEFRDIYSVLASLTWDVRKAAHVGIQGGYARSVYEQEFSADGEQWHGGLFAEIDLPWAHRLRVDGGMQGMSFDRLDPPAILVPNIGGIPTANEIRTNHGDNSDLSPAPYYKLGLSGRLSEKVVHELSAGREASLALFSNHVESYFASYGIHAGLWKGANLGLSGFYEVAEDSGGVFATDTTTYGGVARLQQSIGKLTLAAGYGQTWCQTDDKPQFVNVLSGAFEQQAASVSASYPLCAKASVNVSWQRFKTEWKEVNTTVQDRVMLGMRVVF